MNKTIFLALAIALAAPLAAVADPDNLGVPDADCQHAAEWRTHDYSGSASGAIVAQNGVLLPCSGTNTWDGDYEWALGGALLASNSGDGVTWGSLVCWDMFGHHPQGGTVELTDASGLPVAFRVSADFSSPSSPVPPGGLDCGDGIIEPCDHTPPEPSNLERPVGDVIDTVNALLWSLLNSDGTTCNSWDRSINCLDSCTVPFGPGIDGVYRVFVGPTLTGNNGEPTAATFGHIFL